VAGARAGGGREGGWRGRGAGRWLKTGFTDRGAFHIKRDHLRNDLPSGWALNPVSNAAVKVGLGPSGHWHAEGEVSASSTGVGYRMDGGRGQRHTSKRAKLSIEAAQIQFLFTYLTDTAAS
jgi:hypothetical protein